MNETTMDEWFMAKYVIKTFMKEIRPDLEEEHLDQIAVALIARLASAVPPMLIVYQTNVKE